MVENFPQVHVRYQTTYPGSSENTMQDKCQKEKNKQKEPYTKAYHIQIEENQRKRKKS